MEMNRYTCTAASRSVMAISGNDLRAQNTRAEHLSLQQELDLTVNITLCISYSAD